MTEDGDQGKQRLAILNAFPLLSKPQGDEGNARVLAYRAGLRGIEATVASFHEPGPLPPADLYVVGGLEDEEHTELATRLRAGELADRVREGAVWGRVVGTYLHGSVLGRNPELADLLLALALGRRLEPAAAGRAGELREQRIAEDRADRTGWGGWGGQVHDRPSMTGGHRRRRLR